MNAKLKFLKRINETQGVGYASTGMENKAGLFSNEESVLLQKVIVKNFNKEDVIKITELFADGGLADSIKTIACSIALVVVEEISIKKHSKVLETRLDTKLDALAEEWKVANLLAITNSVKIDTVDKLTESLGLLLSRNKIQVNYDLVTDLKAERVDLKEQLQETLEEKNKLLQACFIAEKTSLIRRMTKNLNARTKVKLLPMLETITPSRNTARDIRTIINFNTNSNTN
jgi:hypothetical protein